MESPIARLYNYVVHLIAQVRMESYMNDCGLYLLSFNYKHFIIEYSFKEAAKIARNVLCLHRFVLISNNLRRYRDRNNITTKNRTDAGRF